MENESFKSGGLDLTRDLRSAKLEGRRNSEEISAVSRQGARGFLQHPDSRKIYDRDLTSQTSDHASQ